MRGVWRNWNSRNAMDKGWRPLVSELVRKYQNGVIPAKAGIQNTHTAPQPSHWIPAFAGMTPF